MNKRNDLQTAKKVVKSLDPELQVSVHAVNHWVTLGILPLKRKIGRVRYFSMNWRSSPDNEFREGGDYICTPRCSSFRL